MKLKIITAGVFLLIGLSCWSQNLNENFDNSNCDVNTCDCCIVNWIDDDNCLPGWFSSHGSPNTVENGDILQDGTDISDLDIDGHGVMMYHCNRITSANPPGTQGEGLFTEFEFVKGRCYNITFDISTDTPIGLLRVFATSGLTGNPSTGSCCNVAPSPSVKDEITEVHLILLETGQFDNWASVNVNYSPSDLLTNTTLDQFWIYPDNHITSGRVKVIVDNLRISEICPPNYEFTDPVVGIPADNYQAGSFIYTGTNGGSGTINSDPNSSTTFRAGHTVQLNPQTFIEVNGSNEFLIEIKNCPSLPADCPLPPDKGKNQRGSNLTITTADGAVHNGLEDLHLEAYEDARKKAEINKQTNLKIYPNPNNGQFTVEMPDYFNSVGIAEVNLYDQVGSLISQESTEQSVLQLNFTQLPKGIYILSIRIEDRLFTEEVTIR